MSLLTIVRFVNVYSTGLLAGILFGDWWGTSPVRPTLPGPAFTLYQQGLHTHFVPLMPILMVTSILSAMLVLVLIRRDYRTLAFGLTALACICVVAAFALTGVVNVPINEELMTWTPSTTPRNWKEIWRPWEEAHTIRTLLALLAFACLLVGVGRVLHEGTGRFAGDR